MFGYPALLRATIVRIRDTCHVEEGAEGVKTDGPPHTLCHPESRPECALDGFVPADVLTLLAEMELITRVERGMSKENVNDKRELVHNKTNPPGPSVWGRQGPTRGAWMVGVAGGSEDREDRPRWAGLTGRPHSVTKGSHERTLSEPQEMGV